MIHDPLPPLCLWGCDPVLVIVPGTGAPSPCPHCTPPLATLHPHLLTPSMPSPRSQPSHTARYPTAIHHPSKSGSICVSQGTQYDVFVSTFPHVTHVPARCLHGGRRCMGSCFLFVMPFHQLCFLGKRFPVFVRALTFQSFASCSYIGYVIMSYMVIFIALKLTGAVTDNISVTKKICDLLETRHLFMTSLLTAVCCVCFWSCSA